MKKNYRVFYDINNDKIYYDLRYMPVGVIFESIERYFIVEDEFKELEYIKIKDFRYELIQEYINTHEIRKEHLVFLRLVLKKICSLIPFFNYFLFIGIKKFKNHKNFEGLKKGYDLLYNKIYKE